jgi:hypothetical protein
MRDPTIDISITTPETYKNLVIFLLLDSGTIRPKATHAPHVLPLARRSRTPASSGSGIQVQQRKSRKPEKQS